MMRHAKKYTHRPGAICLICVSCERIPGCVLQLAVSDLAELEVAMQGGVSAYECVLKRDCLGVSVRFYLMYG